VVVRVVDVGDIGAVASLRSLWSADPGKDPDLERRMAAWLAVEGDRRTTWLATLGDAPVGMASVRGYARLVLSPSARSVPFYRRAGFVVPDDTAGDDRLLVRPSRPGSA
jgi:hypothetical protein